MITPLTELEVVAVVSAFFLLAFAIAEFWWRRWQPPVEYTRKFLHLSCGVIAAPLGWLISSSWIMLGLALIFVTIVTISRRLGMLVCMHGVQRSSHGAALYPLALLVTHLIAVRTGHPEFYCISVLVLAVSDSAASLIGQRYGRHRILIEEDRKSMEGSMAFFFATLLIVVPALAMLTDLGLWASMLCGLYVAALVTCIELLSLSGADNLFIPLAVIAILLKITTKQADEISLQLSLLALDFAVVGILMWRQPRIAASGVIGLALLTYGAHALIGFSWAFVMFLSLALWRISDCGSQSGRSCRIRLVFFTTLNLIFWILATNYLDLPAHIVFPAFCISATGALLVLMEQSSTAQNSNPAFTALILALIFGGLHSLFEPQAIGWFDIGTIFLGTLGVRILVREVDQVHETLPAPSPGQRNPQRHPLADPVTRVQQAAAIGAAVPILAAITSWSFHAALL